MRGSLLGRSGEEVDDKLLFHLLIVKWLMI